MRFALRIGPLEDDARAAIADHDAVLGEGLCRFDREARGMDGHVASAVALGQRFRRQFVQFRLTVAHEGFQHRRRCARRVLERGDKLRHDAAQIADQGHVDRTIDADGRGILFDIDPFADRFILLPVAPFAEMDRFAEFSAKRQHEVGLGDGLNRRLGKDVLEGAVFETLYIAGAARCLDDGAVHQVGQLLDRCAGA